MDSSRKERSADRALAVPQKEVRRRPTTFRWPGGWWRSLLSILLGNLIYFASEPYLPPDVRHEAYSFDAGIVLDFCICLALYGVSCLFWPNSPK